MDQPEPTTWRSRRLALTDILAQLATRGGLKPWLRDSILAEAIPL